MKFALTSIFFILVSLFQLSFGSGHDCMHNELDIVLQETNINDQNQGRLLQEQKMEPIRVTFGTGALDNIPEEYAPVKKQIVTQLELSAKFFTENLNVLRLTSNNKFPDWKEDCGDVIVPTNSTDKVDGIANSDLHIYVDHFTNATRSTLAYASACLIRSADKRPIFGRVAFNLAKFDLAKINQHQEFEDNLETVLHELTHVLGFSKSMYSSFKNPLTGAPYGDDNKPVITKVIRNIETQILTTPKVVELTRQYYGCPTAEGMQLENEGGSGSAGSHWERAVIENEYMTATAISHDAVITDFTFALLEDSGWYEKSAIKTDKIDWGKGKGCNFLESCNPDEFREFNTAPKQCNFYHSGMGYVKLDSPGTYNDKCHITTIWSNRHCKDPNNVSSFDQYSANSYAEQNRCFNSNIAYQQTSSTPLRCLSYECTKGGEEISVIVAGEKYAFDKESNKVTLVKKGKNDKYEGSVEAPENWDAFCNSYHKPCPSFCSSNGYCYAEECHCDSKHAGKDCSIECVDGNYVFQGKCLDSQTCPDGTVVNKPTKECVCPSDQFMHNGACVAQCPEFHYGKEGSCFECDSSCATCSESQFCLTCKEGFNSLTLNGKIDCYQTCPEQYTKTDDNKCKANCLPTCLDCVTPYDCTSCVKGKYLKSSDRYCHDCLEGCEDCTEQECKVCLSGYYKLNGQCVQECPQKYYVSGSDCVSCADNCTGCSEALYCSECSADSHKLFNSSSDKFECVSTCPKGTYLNADNNTCTTCSEHCTECSSATECTECQQGYEVKDGQCSYIIVCIDNCDVCTTESDCQSCKVGHNLHQVQGVLQCVDKCPENWFGNSCRTCAKCPENCTDCQQSLGQECEVCQDGFQLSSDKKCIKCQKNCKSCSSSESCTVCEDKFYSYNDGVNTSCVAECPHSTYADGESKSCEKCSDQCEKCVSKSECITCSEGHFLNQQTQTCEKCGINCLKCSNSQTCLVCVNGTEYRRKRDHVICRSHCPKGQYSNQHSTCSQCPSFCTSCSDENTCDECANSSYFNSQTNKCIKCDQDLCAECAPEDVCTKCISHTYQLYHEDKLVCLNECPKGYTPSNKRICKQNQQTNGASNLYFAYALLLIVGALL